MKTNRTKCLPAREPASVLCLRKLVVPMNISPQSTLALTVNTEVVAGIPRNEILRAAERTKTDLIVMATQGRRGLERWFMGSTAEHTVRYAPCPVLVVRQPGPVREQPAKRKRTARRRSD